MPRRAVFELKGKVIEDFGAPSIEINDMQKKTVKPVPRTVFDYHHDESVMIID